MKLPTMIRPAKSVDKVMSVFTKTITDLKTIAAEQYTASNTIEAKIVSLEQQQLLAEAEAKKAEQYAAKLEALIS